MRTIRFMTVVLTLVAFHAARAQRIERIGVAPHRAASSHVVSKAAALPGNSGMPRWVRWGLAGAIGGAVVFALVDGLNNNSRHSIGSDILAGAATGFVVIGGGVLIYDSLCSPGSGAHSGFCGR